MKHLGWTNLGRVRIGKVIEIEAPEGPPDQKKLDEICGDLLSNPVVEEYSIDITE